MDDAGVSEWSSGQDGVVQLLVDQLEELIVTLLEEIRTRPSVAAAILAGLVGALVGVALAQRARRRRVVRSSAGTELLGALAGAVPRARDVQRGASKSGKRAQQRLGNFGELADLAGLSVRLLENPIVRSYARAAIASQLRKRLGR
jgi:uncharacterized membrane protein YeaQ/YmgE (transglycosylase-associated protein family)